MPVNPDTQWVADQAKRLAHATRDRYIIAIAGVPGSGKSTLAAALRDALLPHTATADAVRIVPMDGFHFHNAELDRRGISHEKGAPHTFDVQRYLTLVRRLRDTASTVSFPVYDRTRHEPVFDEANRESTVTPTTRRVITEGNYLLLDDPPWDELAGLFDETWFIDLPDAEIERRLIERHMRGGRSRADASEHVQRSDMANARRVRPGRARADVVVPSAVVGYGCST